MKIWAVLAVVLLAGCVESGRTPRDGGTHDARDASLCTDEDGDGYGESCARGGDCNDNDPNIHQGCLSCVRPAEGCACENASKPISCYLEPTASDDGVMMCHEGTRYCRDGAWSACESIFTYPKPEPIEQAQNVVNKDAGLEKCSDCRPNCFTVRDNLNPVDGGLGTVANQTQISDGGGLSLGTYTVDAGMDAGSDAGFDASACMVGTAPDKDCDGILDQYDPYPTTKPFATTNPTLFLDIAAGATGTGVINLSFYLNSADVYFLLDQTGSMDAERANLVAGLTTGDYINDPSYNCSDYDFNGSPNNELKMQGIMGAIRCYIRDANFGLGFFRELPFDARGNNWPYYPWMYATNDEIAFRSLQDITSDLTKVTTASGKLATRSNIDWEEAAMPALYSLVSGNGMYFGMTKRSVPSRTDCPANTWGYPCFRNDAIPIVVLFTDAPSHNGPTTNTLPYDANYLNITNNTAGKITAASGNEAYTSATDVGDITNSVVSFTGDTTNMVANASKVQFTCGNSNSSPDAFYKFTLTSTKNVSLTTDNSDFNTVLGVWKGKPSTAAAVATNPSGNDSFTNAYNFGDIVDKNLGATGSTTSPLLTSEYLASDLGCSAYSGSPDAAFKFTISKDTRVALDTAGSTMNTSLSLFSGTPIVPNYTQLPTTSTNDTLATAYDAGTINGMLKAFWGSTDTGPIDKDYSTANVGCAAGDGSPDAVFKFDVTGSGTRRIRVSAEDSTMDTVLALVDNNGIEFPETATSGATGDTVGSAKPLGNIANKTYTMVHDTSTVPGADYAPALFPGCNAGSTKDIVTSFTLSTPKTVNINTIGSATAIDTVVGLFKNSVATQLTTISSGDYENLASAAGPININAEHFVTSGATTVGMDPNYTAAQFNACSGSGVISGSPDAVYKVHLNTAATVRFDTAGSSVDTVMALYDRLPDAEPALSATTGDTVSGAFAITPITSRNRQFTNTNQLSGFNADVLVNSTGCVAHNGGKDVVFTFTPTVSGPYQLDTMGLAQDTVLAVWPSGSVPQLPAATQVTGTNGDTTGNYVDVGTITNTTWKSYYGTITNSYNPNQADFNACNSPGTGKDVYFRFTVPAGQTHSVTIDTIGSAVDTVLGVYTAGMTPTKFPNSTSYCNDEGAAPSDRFSGTFGAGNYYAIIKTKAAATTGGYKITFKNNVITHTAPLACDDNSGGSNTSRLTANLTAGTTYYAVVKGKLPTTTNASGYNFNIRDNDWTDNGRGIHFDGGVASCNDNGTGAAFLELPLAAGDYYLVVKGKNTSGGAYSLSIQDKSVIPDGFVSCNDNSVGTASSLTQTLDSGTYYVVVKARSGAMTTAGKYTLNVNDAAIGAASTLQCDWNTGSGGTSQLERDLSAGTYRVIIKGKANGDKGIYKLQLRDVTSLPSGTGRLACDNNSSAGGKSYIEQDLTAGTYTVLLKGDSSTASGSYKLSVRDATSLAPTENPVACNNDDANGNTTSQILNQSLTPGTYYVGVKGNSSSAKGYYEVHMGGGATTSAKYVPPTWTTTINELKAKKVRVIPILSCKDDVDHGDIQGDCNTARTQYTALANATGAVGSGLNPLIYDINGLGIGLSDTVVKGIASLAQYLEMNVGARVVFDPDANPGFTVVVKAVDKAGDGCDGLVGAEHQKCKPGATPRFEISFTNPASSPVPLNSLAKDPKGGYNFRAELVANNSFIVDQVPIYIIPENVVNAPPPPKVYAMGTYTQNLAADGCAGKTDLPDWNELNWNATVPNGTTVSFAACVGQKAADLATCTPSAICTIKGGAACSAMNPCAAGSFCSPAGNCNTITGASCTTNANCATGATCRSGLCTWDTKPIDVGEVLGANNYQPNLRMQIGLTANTTTNVGPTVKDWSLNYLCKTSL